MSTVCGESKHGVGILSHWRWRRCIVKVENRNARLMIVFAEDPLEENRACERVLSAHGILSRPCRKDAKKHKTHCNQNKRPSSVETSLHKRLQVPISSIAAWGCEHARVVKETLDGSSLLHCMQHSFTGKSENKQTEQRREAARSTVCMWRPTTQSMWEAITG